MPEGALPGRSSIHTRDAEPAGQLSVKGAFCIAGYPLNFLGGCTCGLREAGGWKRSPSGDDRGERQEMGIRFNGQIRDRIRRTTPQYECSQEGMGSHKHN